MEIRDLTLVTARAEWKAGFSVVEAVCTKEKKKKRGREEEGDY